MLAVTACSSGNAGSAGTGGSGGGGGGGAGTGGGAGGGTVDSGSDTGGGSDASDGGGTNCAGNAVSFSANGTGVGGDGAHARVMVDLMTDLPIGNAVRTIEFWAYVKPTDWAGDQNTMFEYGTQGGTAFGFGLDFGANYVGQGTANPMPNNHATIDPYTNGGFDNDSTNDLGITSATTQWVHFAMVWNGTALLTYVNGALKVTTNATGATTMLATARTQLTIGCNNPRFACFNGLIDEFRVWNVARSATDIMANYNKKLVGDETGLVGYWRFDEDPTATMAADSVTSGGHTAHPGIPMAVMPTQLPTFVTPPTPAPILCN
jgi:hypothetical protein